MRKIMKISIFLTCFLGANAVNAATPKFSWLVDPVKMKYFKERAEGYVSEGYQVTDKDNKYTVVCKVSNNGTPTITEWGGAMRVEEIDKKPAYYLNNERGFSELKLKWAEACRELVR